MEIFRMISRRRPNRAGHALRAALIGALGSGWFCVPADVTCAHGDPSCSVEAAAAAMAFRLSRLSCPPTSALSQSAPAQPGAIAAVPNLPYSSGEVTFSVAPVTDAETYFWTVPSYATITSGQCTTSITVSVAGTCGAPGLVSVTAKNNAGQSAAQSLQVKQTLQNGSAELGDLSYWTIIYESGDGWAGSPVPGVGFLTSYFFGLKYQEIDLLAAGYTSAELDASPPIYVGEKFGTPPSWGSGDGYAHIRVELRNASHEVLAGWNIGAEPPGPNIFSTAYGVSLPGPIQGFTNVFTGYPAGVRYIYWQDGAQDNPGWAGYYGPGMSKGYAVVGACAVPY